MANQRKKEVETKLKKVYSVMNQAMNMSVLEYGDFAQWGEEGDCGIGGNLSSCTTSDETRATFNKYIGKHLQIFKIEDDSNNNGIFVYFNDGSILSVKPDISHMVFLVSKKAIDENLRKNGINSFPFRFAPKPGAGVNGLKWNKTHEAKGFEPYSYAWDGSREALFHGPQEYGCGEEVSIYCTKLIQTNGWTIPDDYPYKL